MSGTCVQVWWNTCCKRPCYMYQRRSTHMISDRSVYCQGAFETRTGMCFPPGTQDVSAWNPGTSLAPMVNWYHLKRCSAWAYLNYSKLISNSDVRLQKNSAVGSLHSPGSWPSGFWRKIHAHPRLMRYACHDMSWRSCLHYTWPISRTCWRLAISFSKARSR